ncbi:protein unc-93 homolog A-like [Mytilus galloprovincialis]|uniref:protein unc-93 homolog A-like n=1 Tax=Mytilus galloprovincialis TaxID=29158 RepID=UPI003F7B55A5
MERELKKSASRRSYKNLASVCVGWFLLVVSFGSLQGIVSSINHEDGLGFFSMACFYAGAIVCPFAATIFRRWNTKPVLCVLTLAQIPLVLSYAIPRLYTVLPMAFIGGIAQSVAFSLTGAYLVWVSGILSNAKGDTTSRYLSMAFGIYYMSVSFAPAIGGICSTFILSMKFEQTYYKYLNCTKSLKSIITENITLPNITIGCGPDFCPFEQADVSQFEISSIVRYCLLGFYSLCMVAATIVFSFGMEDKPSTCQKKNQCKHKLKLQDKPDEKYRMTAVLKSTIYVMKQRRFLIVAPLVFYNGFQWAFAVGDIMKAFGGCIFGAEKVGIFIATYHFATCLSSVCSGLVEPRTDRKILFMLACAMHTSACIMMKFWSSYPFYLAYVLCAMWGLGSGTFLAQSHALIGELFPSDVEPAMAVYLMFRSFGHIMGFGYAHFLCMNTKIYVTGGICLVASGFVAVFHQKPYLQKENLKTEKA